MEDFAHEYAMRNMARINPDLFNRAFEKPLVEYIIDTCKNLEVLPGITLESYEFITDQTKIKSEVNKRLIKDPKIKNNKMLERLVQPTQSLYDLLILHYRVKAKGQEAMVTRRLRVPKAVRGGFYIRGGKKVMPLIQIVDNSTFVKGNVLNFKTTLYPIKLYTTKTKLHFIDGGSTEVVSAPLFHLDLFKKVVNPLMYYLANYGLEKTIEMFRLQDIMCVVDQILDEDNYLYLRVNQNLYLEVHEKGFYAHEFVSKFVANLYDALAGDKNKITLQDAYSKDYWLGRLAEIFSKKRSVDKGERVLISFVKIMDPYTKKRLALRKMHKRNTFTIIRWMMVNYDELLKKDSNDLKNKRMRANETQAYFFDSYITRNVYSLLNTDNPPFEKYLKLLNSISEFTLIRSSSGGKSKATSMYRYERFNDFDAIELSRYTLKGPTGLNGGKKKTSIRYRDIYPSQIGRYDLNVCSSSDPGLTGYLTANVQFDKNGYFDTDSSEPDEYDTVIDVLIEKRCVPGYHEQRMDYIQIQLSRDSNGFMTLRRKRTTAEWNAEFNRDPWSYGLYPAADGLHLIHKQERDQKGFISLIKHTPTKRDKRAEEENFERDEDGFIVLKKIELKIDRKKQHTRRMVKLT